MDSKNLAKIFSKHYITVDNSYNLLYTVCIREEIQMKIIISHSSMVPIYEQLIDQIKTMILNEELKENDALPSVRALAKELKISALTVKKAYDNLEEDGFTVTVHGKGTYVAQANKEAQREAQQREVEEDLEAAVSKARRYGMEDGEIRELFALIMEE